MVSTKSLAGVVTCLAFCSAAGVVWSQGKTDPAAVLKEKGLRVVSGIAVLGDESKVTKMLGDVPKFRRELIEANKSLATAERSVLQKDSLIQQYVQERRKLNAQLANVQNVEQNNKLVAAINELTDRINLLSDSEQLEKHRKEQRAKVNEVREKYVDHVLEARKIYDALQRQYEALAADSTLTAAIQELSESSGKPVKLGPSRSFGSTGNSLKKLEDTVLSEKIPLRRSDGGVYYVSAVVNGKKSQEFVLDTGASILAIPARIADEIGITVPSSAPTMRLQLADGRTIEARQVFAKTVRVGKFTVENVECAVLPPTAANAEPLLGQSFLRQFSYKIDGDTGSLIMTKVEGEEETTTKGRPTRKSTSK